MLAYVFAPGLCVVARLLSLVLDTSHDFSHCLCCRIVGYIEAFKPLREEYLIAVIYSLTPCQESRPKEACAMLETNVRVSHGWLQASTNAGHLVLQNYRINVVYTAVEVYAQGVMKSR